ncbi:hypothetical protein ACIBVL_34110 [Streptomyces sp. NPDC049687]|uniref:hypothetical protein n=1 Tax=Streptomyces sp. NPDC049687 TaxID=3365596 RepID=UPI003799BCC4
MKIVRGAGGRRRTAVLNLVPLPVTRMLLELWCLSLARPGWRSKPGTAAEGRRDRARAAAFVAACRIARAISP